MMIASRVWLGMRHITSRSSWRLPDVRRATPTLHGNSSGLAFLKESFQRQLPDKAVHHRGRFFGADGQSALASRPHGRPSRLSDPRATAHYRSQRPQPRRMNAASFRKLYNSS